VVASTRIDADATPRARCERGFRDFYCEALLKGRILQLPDIISRYYWRRPQRVLFQPNGNRCYYSVVSAKLHAAVDHALLNGFPSCIAVFEEDMIIDLSPCPWQYHHRKSLEYHDWRWMSLLFSDDRPIH